MEILILQTPMKEGKGEPMLRKWEMIPKDVYMHAGSLITTQRNTAPTTTQVQNIDRVQDLGFPRSRN